MSKKSRKKILFDLKEIRNKVEELEKEMKVVGEDFAYNLKLYIRELGLERRQWCEKYNIPIDLFEEDLKNENIPNLKKYLEILLTGKNGNLDSSLYLNSANNINNMIGVNSIVKAMESKDNEKLWAVISYYILMNHKNIQKFCNDMSEKGFNVKYSTFRTDKYNKGLHSAVKYANIILEFVKLANSSSV